MTDFDPELIDRVRRRDEDAMNVFFETFFPRVFGYVMTLVRDRTLADDLVQESFVRLHRAMDRLDPERDPSAWVFTVVANTVRDHWRSKEHRSRGRMVDVDELWDQPDDDHRDPAAQMVATGDQADIRLALEQLAPGDREIILLREYEELETSEIADALGLSPEAVRQRHSRAVRRLGKIYREMFGEDQVTP